MSSSVSVRFMVSRRVEADGVLQDQFSESLFKSSNPTEGEWPTCRCRLIEANAQEMGSLDELQGGELTLWAEENVEHLIDLLDHHLLQGHERGGILAF